MDESERHFLEITRQVMTDDSMLQVNISIMQAWLLVSALQLATRHPGIQRKGRLVGPLKDIAQQFIDAICAQHPEARKPLEMGFDPKLDK